MEMKKQAKVRRAFLEKTLDGRVVANPTYDEQGKSPCDEGTRIAELAAIKKWLTSISSDSQNFLWLTGDPGCGKSAITASIARDCKDDGTLWAQFFINRNNRETTDPNSYFPTIARQLADRSPDVQRVIYDRLSEKRSLMDRISSQQAAKLFVDALGVASRLQWFPAKEEHSGFWASLDNCLIRGNEDGSIVVLPEPPIETITYKNSGFARVSGVKRHIYLPGYEK